MIVIISRTIVALTARLGAARRTDRTSSVRTRSQATNRGSSMLSQERRASVSGSATTSFTSADVSA